MTADVFLGVRDKCEASGIKHYISKPFDPNRFIQTIEDIIKDNKEEEISNQTKANNNNNNNNKGTTFLDINQGISNMGGSIELYNSILREYLEENKDIVLDLRKSIENNNNEEAVEMVHKVKSSSGSIGAKHNHKIAKELQKALEDKNTEEIAKLNEEFSIAFKELLLEIKEHLDSKK